MRQEHVFAPQNGDDLELHVGDSVVEVGETRANERTTFRQDTHFKLPMAGQIEVDVGAEKA